MDTFEKAPERGIKAISWPVSLNNLLKNYIRRIFLDEHFRKYLLEYIF